MRTRCEVKRTSGERVDFIRDTSSPEGENMIAQRAAGSPIRAAVARIGERNAGYVCHRAPRVPRGRQNSQGDSNPEFVL